MPKLPKLPVKYIPHKYYPSVQIYNHVYRKSLQIFRGDLKKFRKVYKTVCENVTEEYMQSCWGLAIWSELWNVVWLNNLDRQTLIHELQHIMFFRYGTTVSTLDTKNIATQEFFCYSLEFCLNMIKLTPLFKKLKRF